MSRAPVMARAAPEGPASGEIAGGERRRLHSRELLAGAREIEIVHGSQCYRLRLTSLGKLILTK